MSRTMFYGGGPANGLRSFIRCLLPFVGLLLFLTVVRADTVFVEAEMMKPSSSGWAATNNDQTQRASRTKTLWGADGAGDAGAKKTVRVTESGRYRMWVRYMQVGAWRGPFQLAVSAGEKQLAAKTFDLDIQPGVADWEYTWQSFEADLPAGEVTLSLTKHEQKNCVGYVRHVDCVLLTSDLKLVPDHLPFGPQTLVRVTMGEGYDRPVYLHMFADHYRSPWYAHFAIGRDGIRAELAPPAEQMMKPGDVTPWCNLTPTVYQDSGAALNLSVRHSYHEKATRIIEEAYGRSFPTLVNFSDGAVYHANFCGQGIDYFELLDADDQNAIWGEDWANNSSTYQCGAFNVALMQAAARKRGQTIGHYLIAHAGQTPWDIKTKAVAETARGVRLWMNFAYGPNWSSHEGGPTWRSHLWHHRPDLWTANAEISREIGAVEDWLVTAKPAPAEVAILYSSSSDIWTMQSNVAFGHDRMHTWLALTHAQTPVDIVPEREMERLDQYKVCYLSGPNLTRAAAAKLRTWVESGGTLWLTAGAASRDEFNRPLETLVSLLPAERGELTSPEPYNNSGKFLSYLNACDTVTWGDQPLEVLSVMQSLKSRGSESTEVLATFNDGQPAAISGRIGQGNVIVTGFLPALSYIKPALLARRPLEQQADTERLAKEKLAEARAASANADQPLATNATVSAPSTASSLASADRELLDRSHNPWRYPAGIRDRLLTPVRSAKLAPSLTCDTPLIDAVELRCEQGVLIALSNHTLQPLDRIELRLKTDKPVTRVESARHGPISFERLDGSLIRVGLPLEASDFVTVSTQANAPAQGALSIGKLRVGKVLFLGNSITLHGPAPKIGWTGNWGMAASAENKDYVHLLTSQIAKAAGGKPEVKVKNIADFERRLADYKLADELKEELAFEPDVIIVALGENAASPKTDDAKAQFETAFTNLFAELKQHGQPTLFVRSQFWQDADKDRLMQKTCEAAGGTFVDISKLGFEATNYVRAERKIEHAGVAGHPGDKGMQALADALWNAIQKRAESSR